MCLVGIEFFFFLKDLLSSALNQYLEHEHVISGVDFGCCVEMHFPCMETIGASKLGLNCCKKFTDGQVNGSMGGAQVQAHLILPASNEPLTKTRLEVKPCPPVRIGIVL